MNGRLRSRRGAFRPRLARWYRTAALAGIATTAVLAGGCATATNSFNPGHEIIATAKSAALGTIVVDDNARTLYLFVKDPPAQTTCFGACASIWPPVTTADVPGAKGVAAAKLSTIHRDDGGTQVVYDGHPLYYYQADTQPGDIYGEGLAQFGAEWYALSPAGQQVEPKGGGGGGS